MKNTLMKAVLSCMLAAVCAVAYGQSRNDPQRSDAKIRLGTSFTWTSILNNDDTPLRHVGNISAPEKGTDRYDFWSIGCETMDRDYAYLSSYRQYLSELGAGYGRLMSGWAKTEKVRGQYDFSWLDDHVDGLTEEGVKPWMCLCYGNELYSDSGTMLFSRIISGDGTLDAWERYVEALVQRYKGRIHMYEIWNEPNFGAIYKDPELKKEAFRRYNELVFRTIRAIRKFDRKTPVAAGSLATWLDIDFCRSFISYLREKGMEKELQYITFHPYGSNPEKKLGEIIALRDFLKKEAPWIGLLEGEVGIKSLDVQSGNVKYNETSQTKWILRHMAMEFGLGIPCSIFSMIDNRYPHKLQSYGMLCADLMGRALYKRPQFYGYQNMISVLDKTVKAGPALPVDIDAPRQLYSISLKKGGRVKGLMLWFGNDTPSMSCAKTPVCVKVAGMKLKHPVYADMATGRVFELEGFQTTSEGMEFPGLPLWDSPVLVMEADAFRWDRVEPGDSFKKVESSAPAPIKKVTAISPEGCRQITDTLRILGVGNSWTRDSMRWLSAIARSAGVPVIVGHAYLGGSTLLDQFRGIDDPTYTYHHGKKDQVVHSTYQYWKYACTDNPVKTPKEGYANGLAGIGVTLESVVVDEPWDVIVFQPEGTAMSGPLFDAYAGAAGKDFSLRILADRILGMMEPSVAGKVRLGLMVPFGYPQGNEDHRRKLPVNLGVPAPVDQEGWDALYVMQHETLQRNMPLLARSLGASIYVNVGQAVWAARQHPELSKSGFRLQRSKANTHLSEGLAMYVASLSYAFAILNLNPADITFYPSKTADPLLTGDRGETEEIKLENTPELAREAIRVVYEAVSK